MEILSDSVISIDSLSLVDNNEESTLTDECRLAGEAIKLIINTFPRSASNSEDSRLNKISVSIGAAESTDLHGKTSLLQYRKFLVAKFIAKSLGKSGYFVDQKQFCVIPKESDYRDELFIVREDGDGQKAALRLSPGKVTAKLSTHKEPKGIDDMTAEIFHSLRSQGGKHKTVQKEVDISWLISGSNLTTAIMNFDILIKDPSADIEILAIEHKDAENSEMLFIMYNYARLLAILRRFEDSVKNEEYPPLPPVETVDFDLLSSKDEKSISKLIVEWPTIVERTVDFEDLEINIAANLKCVKELAVQFSNFYSYTRVLMPTKSHHIFNKMYARIYMLQACVKVFEEFLELMQIESYGGNGLYHDNNWNDNEDAKVQQE